MTGGVLEGAPPISSGELAGLELPGLDGLRHIAARRRWLDMPMRVFLLLVLIAVTTAAEPPAALAVVRTWQELAAQPAIRLPDGRVARVGVQTLAAPVGSAVAVYVLTPRTAFDDHPHADACGPLRVVWSHPRILQPVIQRGLLAGAHLFNQPPDHDLYARIIPVSEPGSYHLTVCHDDQAVAQADLIATSEPHHPWYTLRWPPQHNDQRDPLSREALLGPDVAAVPDADPTMPWITVGDAEFVAWCTAPSRPLPSADPQIIDLRVQVRVVDGTLHISIPAECGSWLHDSHLTLARWWRNGQPWIPEALHDEPDVLLAESEIKPQDGTRHLRMQFLADPDQEHALVEVQLLLMQHPWKALGGQEQMQLLRYEAFEQPTMPLLLLPRVALRHAP